MKIINLLWLLLLAFPAQAAGIVGRVVSVADGDTLTVLVDRQQIKVRLAEIDAPERKQPFGTRSRQSLADMCFGKSATLETQAHDRYGRTVARVNCAGVDANAEQVRRGMAWVYDYYAKDKTLYSLQDAARRDRRGLWVDQHPVPPWEWRRSRRQPHRGRT